MSLSESMYASDADVYELLSLVSRRHRKRVSELLIKIVNDELTGLSNECLAFVKQMEP